MTTPNTDATSWRDQARPYQAPPTDGDWKVYLLCAGRGAGMTWAGAHWLAEQALTNPGVECAVVGPTWTSTRQVCIEGASGLLKALADHVETYVPADGSIRLTNGSIIRAYSGDRPDRLIDAAPAYAWVDCLAQIARPDELWDTLTAVLPDEPRRLMATTTPRPIPLLRRLVGCDDGSVRAARASTWDNLDNLSPNAVAGLRERYEGTRLGLQDLKACSWTANQTSNRRSRSMRAKLRTAGRFTCSSSRTTRKLASSWAAT